MPDFSFCAPFWTEGIVPLPGRSQRLGIEIELHAFDAHSLTPLGLGQCRVSPQDLLLEIAKIEPDARVQREEDTDVVISVSRKNQGNFTIEPGGQIEYSSGAYQDFASLNEDVSSGLRLLSLAAKERVLFLSHGTNPLSLSDHPLVYNKIRYQKMARFYELERQNNPQARGPDMMRRTAALQVSLDVCYGQYWEQAVRLVAALVPLTRYLFANSAYWEGGHSLFPSERQAIWAQMDQSRSGIPSAIWNEPVAQAYAQWAHDAQVLFIQNLPVHKQPEPHSLPFLDWFWQGHHKYYPCVSDWHLHLSTLFPDVRLRHFIEIRHIDAQPIEHIMAPVVFFHALLGSEDNRMQTWKFLYDQGWQKDMWTNKIDDLHARWHLPLLSFARRLLEPRQDPWMLAVIDRYEHFYKQRQSVFASLTAREYVEKYATLHPHRVFAGMEKL